MPYFYAVCHAVFDAGFGSVACIFSPETEISTGLFESENLYPLFYLSDRFLPYTDITYYKRARFPDNVIKLR